MADVVREHIEIMHDGGRSEARIAGHRIRVLDVAIWHERLGMTPDEIVDQYPTLTLADVYAALAHYWDYRETIDAAIAAEEALAAELRRRIPSPVAEKLARNARGDD
jgi:uncharacterized protein (DUF433 family)